MKAVKIVVEFENGTIKTAEGDHAHHIWVWWNNCETIAIKAGLVFSGRPLVDVPEPETETTQ